MGKKKIRNDQASLTFFVLRRQEENENGLWGMENFVLNQYLP